MVVVEIPSIPSKAFCALDSKLFRDCNNSVSEFFNSSNSCFNFFASCSAAAKDFFNVSYSCKTSLPSLTLAFFKIF